MTRRTIEQIVVFLAALTVALILTIGALVVTLVVTSRPAGAGELTAELELSVRAKNDQLGEGPLDSPLGTFALVYYPSSAHGWLALFGRHTSSIPNTKDGGGLNEAGARLTIKLD